MSVPKELLNDALSDTEDFAGLELQTQLLYSAADQVSKYYVYTHIYLFSTI